MASIEKYNFPQIAMHWINAVLIIFLLIMGSFVLSHLPNSDPGKLAALKGHMILGFSALLLTAVRILWRKKSAQPNSIATSSSLLDKSAIAAHIALNLLVLIVAMSGIGIALQSGLVDIVFLGTGALPVDFFEYPARIAHGLLTKVLLGVISLHFIAALYHQLVLKDQLFKRVSPFKS